MQFCSCAPKKWCYFSVRQICIGLFLQFEIFCVCARLSTGSLRPWEDKMHLAQNDVIFRVASTPSVDVSQGDSCCWSVLPCEAWKETSFFVEC